MTPLSGKACAMPSAFDGSELERLVALNMTQRVGQVAFSRLLEAFGSTESAFAASFDEIAQVVGHVTAQAINEVRHDGRARREMENIAELGVTIVPRGTPEYPAMLGEIPHPPIVLYVRGDILPTDSLALAIVGSRRASFYGLRQAKRFGAQLAAMGFTIVSGLARGIDTAAHEGALEVGGRTIGVSGCGIDTVYPRENASLYERVAQSGAVMTEFPSGFPVRAGNFPRRNRIISGLSLGVIVVEATARSGALITARFAGEHGREVFALPGKVDSPTSRGAHDLIRDGAKLVTDVADVVRELGPVADKVKSTLSVERTPVLQDDEKTVYDLLGSEPISVDAVIAAGGLPPGRTLAALATLKIKRLAVEIPGKLYAREAGGLPGG